MTAATGSIYREVRCQDIVGEFAKRPSDKDEGSDLSEDLALRCHYFRALELIPVIPFYAEMHNGIFQQFSLSGDCGYSHC